MKTMRSGDAIWLVRASAGVPVPVRREGVRMLARAAGIAGLTVGAALGLAPGEAPAVGAPAPAAQAPVSIVALKDATRLAAWAAPPRATAPAPAGTFRILDPRAASPGGARFVKSDPAVTGSFRPGAFEPAPAARAGEWREEEFALVQALDGRTLATPSVRIRLTGLVLPSADEVCRTLDGRLEACAARAATQLELMTRHRKVACRFRGDAPGEASGACRIGASDLADRMVRTGLVRRLPEAGRVAVASAAAD
ncbi:MAG TPA: hypothetical protein VF601_10270 [Beijerinckiaceae bacterium]|jgi:hypothetical protein